MNFLAKYYLFALFFFPSVSCYSVSERVCEFVCERVYVCVVLYFLSSYPSFFIGMPHCVYRCLFIMHVQHHKRISNMR